jgi:hypothetical protein
LARNRIQLRRITTVAVTGFSGPVNSTWYVAAWSPAGPFGGQLRATDLDEADVVGPRLEAEAVSRAASSVAGARSAACAR